MSFFSDSSVYSNSKFDKYAIIRFRLFSSLRELPVFTSKKLMEKKEEKRKVIFSKFEYETLNISDYKKRHFNVIKKGMCLNFVEY